jgi:hypothetical protein
MGAQIPTNSSHQAAGEESEEWGLRSTYVPGTAACIHGAAGSGSAAGGLVVVSWTPVSATSVERAASQPVSSTRFPVAISAGAGLLQFRGLFGVAWRSGAD